MYYHITSPRKQGNIDVVDIKELQGNMVMRVTTIKLEDLMPFIWQVFHDKDINKVLVEVEQ